MPDLELSELLLRLRQAYRGEALEIPPERIEQPLLQHEDATTEASRITPAEAHFLADEKVRFGICELAGGVLVSELRCGQDSGIGAITQVHIRYHGLPADGRILGQSESTG